MLDEFIVANRDAIIVHARIQVATRAAARPSAEDLKNGVPAFLDQLCDALRLAKSSDVIDHEQIKKSASRHGQTLHELGLPIGLVVRAYGDVCQAITELAIELAAPITGDDFRTLNLCLDHAIAAAVTAFAEEDERTMAKQGTERLGLLAHELRNLLNTAMLAFESIKSGRVAAAGSTGVVLDRSLSGIGDLVARSLADVRLDVGIEHRERIDVAEFVAEVEISASIQAAASGLRFAVTSPARGVYIAGDRQILAAALANLLQNALKFTPKDGNVWLRTSATRDRVLFEIEDECGGLPPGTAAGLFRPFEQRGADRRGVGLGLSICLKAAQASAGEIRVHDLPGKGCVFTLDLPRVPSRATDNAEPSPTG